MTSPGSGTRPRSERQRDALSGARLAYEPHCLARAEVEGDVVRCHDDPTLRREHGHEVPHGQDRVPHPRLKPPTAPRPWRSAVDPFLPDLEREEQLGEDDLHRLRHVVGCELGRVRIGW